LIAVSRQHPLAGRKNIKLADLRSSEWIDAHPSAARCSVFEGLFEDGDLPRFNVETHSLPAIFVLLASGRRMAILTRSELALDQRLGNQLTHLDYLIDEPPAPRRRTGWRIRAARRRRYSGGGGNSSSATGSALPRLPRPLRVANRLGARGCSGCLTKTDGGVQQSELIWARPRGQFPPAQHSRNTGEAWRLLWRCKTFRLTDHERAAAIPP
jgi:hypothetical protein